MPFRLNNPYLDSMTVDMLYHFGLSQKNTDFGEFHDVRFVCTGGSKTRMQMYARSFGERYGLTVVGDISKSDRFCLYKTGFVLWCNHGMGVASMSIMLNEIFKLLHYAGIVDVTIIRLGTSGGVGVEPGTVVVSNDALNGKLHSAYELEINGKTVTFPVPLDEELVAGLFATAQKLQYTTSLGKTLCANDFYEGQMRLDGCFQPGSIDDKMQFLKRISDLGVKNIEMECTGFAAMCHRVGARAAIVCVTLLNRMAGDQILINDEAYKEFEMRPFNVVTQYISDIVGYQAIMKQV